MLRPLSQHTYMLHLQQATNSKANVYVSSRRLLRILCVSSLALSQIFSIYLLYCASRVPSQSFLRLRSGNHPLASIDQVESE